MDLEVSAADSTLQMYYDSLSKILWSQRAFRELNSQLSKFSKPKITENQWNSIVLYYITSLINFPDPIIIKEVYTSTINYISTKLSIPFLVVQSIFMRSYSELKIKKEGVPDMVIKNVDGNRVSVNIGVINTLVPKETYEMFKENEEVFKRLIIRYSLLDTSSGYFWSMPPKMIKDYDSHIIPTLECYASPFNFSARNFCSLFKEDTTLSYPNGVKCHGDFSTVLSRIGENVNVRLFYNPPYFDKIMESSVKQLVSFLLKSPRSELFALLPDWNRDYIDDLLKLEGVSYQVLKSEDNVIYSHYDEKLFSPHNVNFILIIKVGSLENSRSYLNQIIEKYFKK